MVTMHDLMDAQWVYDNTKDGKFGQLIIHLEIVNQIL